MVREVLSAEMGCTEPERVVESGDFLQQKSKIDGDMARGVAHLGNCSNVRQVILIVFVRQAITAAYAVKLCLRFLLELGVDHHGEEEGLDSGNGLREGDHVRHLRATRAGTGDRRTVSAPPIVKNIRQRRI